MTVTKPEWQEHARRAGEHDRSACPECRKRAETIKKERSKRPSVGQLKRWMNEGGCETPCGCWVEPDGTCEHGEQSWMLIMGLI
jgi:hypothetical protein